MLKKSHPNIVFDKKGVGYLDDAYGNAGDNLMFQTRGIKKGTFYNFEDPKQAGDTLKFYAIFFYLEHDFYNNLKRITEYFPEYFQEYLLSQSEAKPLSNAELQAVKARQEIIRLKTIEAEKQEQLEKQAEIEKAKRIKAYSKIITSDNLIVQPYLKARLIPFHSWTDTIRFISKYYHAVLQKHLPVIICDMTDAKTGEFTGLEINYLPDVILSTAKEYNDWFKNLKTYKRNTVGRKKGSVIRILDNPNKKILAIFEGYADGLSLAFHNRELRIITEETPNIWVTMGNNAENIDLPLGRYETVYICADSDSAGEKLVDCFRKKYEGQNIRIKERTFDGFKDCNEYIISEKEAIYETENLKNLKERLEAKAFENRLLKRKRPNDGVIQSL
jgi:5S rRNA maturation endonuclease (ribonuclease M5)